MNPACRNLLSIDRYIRQQNGKTGQNQSEQKTAAELFQVIHVGFHTMLLGGVQSAARQCTKFAEQAVPRFAALSMPVGGQELNWTLG